DPQLVTSAVSLPNDKLKIELFDPDGLFVDAAGDGTAPPAGFSSSTKASMLRTPNGDWKTSDTRERMDEGIADFGTPGICDGCAWSEAYLAAADATTTDAGTMTTSTEPLVEPTASSTVAEVETATSSASTPVTEEVTTTTIETIVLTETTSTVPETVNLSTTPPASTTLAVTVTTRVIAYPAFRLHRVYPAPSSGKKEWVEIKLPDGTSLTDLDEYALYDATGRVMRFPPSDMTLISQVDRVMRLQLTSAKLNNGGDTVELRRPDGSVVERMTYPKTTSGQSWIKNAQETAWILEDITEAEVQESKEETVYAPPPSPIELIALETASNENQETDEIV
ncbi:MAG: lamin tail domain-containing protein, partial [Patescibacteria group bacterium]